MNKITILSILMLITLPALATDSAVSVAQQNPIEDELIKTEVFEKSIKPNYVKNNQTISDELLDIRNYKTSPFRLGAYINKFKGIPISDELIDNDYIQNADNIQISKQEFPDDYFIEKSIDVNKTRKIKSKTKYDFTQKQVPIKIRIAEHLKSTKETIEGASIPFIAEHDFVIKDKKYQKGTTIIGRVETISDSDKMGVPECLKIDNFYIPDGKDEINLSGSISKNGANRTIWVYPLYQAGNICLYVAGFVFVPIHGGKAKLLTSESFTVFYETQ